jgi:V/A-type H+-transporting ATPase subunit E
MQNKLQELTDKLYNEGLSKGKQEGEELLAKAKAQVDDMLAKAQAEAAQIIAAAQKQAEEIKTKTASDIKMASSQSIAATKKDIESLIVGKMTGDAVKKTLSSADFIKDLIKAVAEKFTTDGPVDLNLVLPESLKNDLEPFATKELAKILGAGVEASFSKKVTGGFQIGPKDGGYFVSFSEETFNQLISEYLRPATKKLLFG